MTDSTNIVRMYANGRDLGAVNFQTIPTISAEPEPNESVETAPASCLADRAFTFTAKAFKIPKSWRRIPVCKSRKRFIKKMMAIGFSRNRAAGIADMAKQFNGGLSYQQMYRAAYNKLSRMSEQERKELLR